MDRSVADSFRDFWDKYTNAIGSFYDKLVGGNAGDITWGEATGVLLAVFWVFLVIAVVNRLTESGR